MMQQECYNQINHVFFILTKRQLSVNSKDLQAPNLVGPTQLYQGSGPLAVLHLDNRLRMLATNTTEEN